MKRARAEADGDSDAEDPGTHPEAEGPGQEEEDEAEYFRQAVGEEPDEGMWQGLVRPGTMGLSLCPDTVSLQICSQTPSGDGPSGLQARSSGSRNRGQMEAVTGGIQRPRTGPGESRPSWGPEGLLGTMDEAKPEQGHLREWPEARPEQQMECPRLGPERCCPGLPPGQPGAVLSFLS